MGDERRPQLELESARRSSPVSGASRSAPSRDVVAPRPRGVAAGARPGMDDRAQTIIWRALGGIGRGSLVEPDRYSSTPAAQARPSAIAQTIND
jgi:hypothetical protein